MTVARDEAEAQAQAPRQTARCDEDVLDTWYSSALVPSAPWAGRKGLHARH